MRKLVLFALSGALITGWSHAEAPASVAPAEPEPASAQAAPAPAAAADKAAEGVRKKNLRARRSPRHVGPDGRPLRRAPGAYGAPRRGVLGIIVRDFGTLSDGRTARLFRVMGAGGLVADFSDHGARLVRLYAPDRNGNLADVTVGHNSVEGYEKYDRNFNSTVGRFANRIAAGRFTLDGQAYQLPLNWGPEGKRCCLHGGTNAMNFAIWQARPVRRPDAAGVEFRYVSPDGDQGFPGKMSVKVTHWITKENVWAIDYEATVEGKACPINLTNHAYFNLKGPGKGDACDHVLQIFADKITPVDDGLIPTGELMPVEGTPFDFRTPQTIGARLGANHVQLARGKGYDHNWVVDEKNDGTLKKVAVLSEPVSGRYVETWTTEPGLQFYGGNVMSGGAGAPQPVPDKTGGTLPWRGAIALETQHFPDSPNQPNFPPAVLRPGEIFTSRTEYRFGAK